MKHQCLKTALRRGVCLASSLAMVASISVVPTALADDQAAVYNAPTKAMTVDKNYVTATAKAYAQGTPDMLGVTNTTFNGSSSAGAAGAVSAAQINNMYGMYGSDANSAPNPYIYNYFYNLYAAENGLEDSDQATLWTKQGGPTSADTTIDSTYGTSLGLARRPDIIYGNGGTATTGSDGTTVYSDSNGLAASRGWGGYAQLILEIRTWTNDESKVGTTNADGNTMVYSKYYQEGDENYNPIGLSADSASTPYTFLSKCVWPMAEAAQTVITESKGTKYLRYSEPYTQATNIELYSKAPSWYVMSQLEKDGKDKKTGIIVSGVDESAKTVNVIKFNYNSEAEQFNMSTVIAAAAQETLTDAAASISTTKVEVTQGRNKSTVDQATLSDVIAAKPDVIITTSTGVATKLQGMYEAEKATMPSQVWDEQEAKLLFNTWDGARSPECLMATGMIQGFLYPEYISQVNLLTWYMEKVVGLTNNGMAQFYGISFQNMSLAEGQQWTTDGYDEQTITDQLNAGTMWYLSNKSKADKANPNLKATSDFIANWNDIYFESAQAAEKAETAKAAAAEKEAAVKEAVEAANKTAAAEKEAAVKEAVEAANKTAAAEKEAAVKEAVEAANKTAAAEKEAAVKAAVEAANQTAATEKDTAVTEAKASQMAQNLVVNTANKAVKCAKGKNKLTKAATTAKVAVSGAQGKLTYAKVSGSAKLSIVSSTKGFKIKVKKGTAKGTYTIKVKVSAAESGDYKATATTVTITVVVK